MNTSGNLYYNLSVEKKNRYNEIICSKELYYILNSDIYARWVHITVQYWKSALTSSLNEDCKDTFKMISYLKHNFYNLFILILLWVGVFLWAGLLSYPVAWICRNCWKDLQKDAKDRKQFESFCNFLSSLTFL